MNKIVILLETGHPRRSGRESKVLIALLIYRVLLPVEEVEKARSRRKSYEAGTQIMEQIYSCQRYYVCGSYYQTVSIHRGSSYAKCPDIAVGSEIKGITLFKLSMLLLCNKSTMVVYSNNQKPFFMSLG